MSTPLPSPPAPDLAALPDRALDAALAVALFGFREERQPPDYDGNHGGEPVLLQPGNHPDEPDNGWRWPVRGKVAFDSFVPRYSSDPAAALAVVEAMGERFGAYPSCLFEPGAVLVMFRVSERVSKGAFETWFPGRASAPTFPRAICLAALHTLHAAGQLPPSALA